MEIASLTLLGNSLVLWGMALGIACGAFLMLRYFSHFLRTKLPDLIPLQFQTRQLFTSVLTLNTFLLVMLALFAGLSVLSLPPAVEKLAFRLLFVAVAVQVGILASKVAWVFCVKAVDPQSATYKSAAHSLIMIVSRLVIWALLFLLVLENWGVNITALVAGLGVGGIAVALAVQNVLGDIFASLAIILDKPFELGDFIVVDDVMGNVEYIGVKTTRIRSLSGEQVILANAQLLSGRIRNYKRMYERRVLFNFGLTYDTSNEKLAQTAVLVKAIVEAQGLVRFDRAHFTGFGDSSLNYEVVYFVKSPDYNVYMDIQQRINLAIKNEVERMGAKFAFPTRTVYLQQSTEQDAAVS